KCGITGVELLWSSAPRREEAESSHNQSVPHVRPIRDEQAGLNTFTCLLYIIVGNALPDIGQPEIIM
ncbi:MAG: hypothetical protein DRP11_04495, partial [Candidatus Aenigmatarchaeota archaeon]